MVSVNEPKNQIYSYTIIFKSGKVSKFSGRIVDLYEIPELQELVQKHQDKLQQFLILQDKYGKFFIVQLSEVQQIEIDVQFQNESEE